MRNLFRSPHYVDDILLQMDAIGVGSLPIVMLIGLFSGLIMGNQMARALRTYGAEGQIGPIVSFTIIRELGHETLTAGTAEQALAVVEERADIDLLFTDIGLQQDSEAGLQLARDVAELGFGLDLATCAAGGNAADLAYVSPKSGRAVSRQAVVTSLMWCGFWSR